MMIESIVKYNVCSPIQINGFLFALKDAIKSQASSVKTVMVAHQQLIGEVKAMLTTMAKVTDKTAFNIQNLTYFCLAS